jgi:hypothetical protein
VRVFANEDSSDVAQTEPRLFLSRRVLAYVVLGRSTLRRNLAPTVGIVRLVGEGRGGWNQRKHGKTEDGSGEDSFSHNDSFNA